MKIEKLGKYISEVSIRNKRLFVTDVFSVTNSQGFVKSTDYFNKEVFSKDISNYKIVSSNQFAYNPSRINVGSIDYLKIQSSVIISPLYVVFKCADGLNEEFLKVFLKSPVGNTRIRSKTKGAVRDSVSFGSLSEIRIPIPSISDQLHIANFLSKAETLISLRKESIAILEGFLKSSFLEMFGDPIINSRNWNFERLDKIATLERGRFSPRPRNDPSYFNGKYPFIQTGDISKSGNRLKSFTQTLNEKGIKESKKFKKGTIVIAIVGATIGASAILEIDVYATDSIIGITPKNEFVNNIFLEFVMQFWKPVLLKNAPEAARPNINLEILGKLGIIIPPIELQLQFTKFVEKAEALKIFYQSSLMEMENLYGSLSQRAFRGELQFQQITKTPIIESDEKEKLDLISQNKRPSENENKEDSEIDVLKKSAKKVFPYFSPAPTYQERIKQSYKIYKTINSSFRNEYFTFEQIKEKLIERGHEYKFEIIRDEIFNFLRDNKLKQVFADATFKSSFDNTHPDYNKVQDLEERIHFIINSDRQ